MVARSIDFLRRLVTLGLLTFSTALLAEGARELSWDDLVPNSDGILLDSNGEPAASPTPGFGTVPELSGAEVKLPGFVVPLDMSGETVSSFLLVPYFGACIHMPPPPPNQTVLVTVEEAIAMETMYYPVWVTGILKAENSTSALAEAGYKMQGLNVERFVSE